VGVKFAASPVPTTPLVAGGRPDTAGLADSLGASPSSADPPGTFSAAVAPPGTSPVAAGGSLGAFISVAEPLGTSRTGSPLGPATADGEAGTSASPAAGVVVLPPAGPTGPSRSSRRTS
jgi:hypothetical protein